MTDGVVVTLGGLAVAEIAAVKDVPLEYYAATIVVLGGIYGIIRTVLLALAWLDKRDLVHRNEILKEIRQLIGNLPCQKADLNCKEEE
jgi:hypothetical protein